ncbi:3-hydroxyacyl-ACP dehydratase [Opitutaceae bacterium TAV5]|nr:3-hydroxyacyl-ACP dehydratase [Opitutaceae bacterium TAV5]
MSATTPDHTNSAAGPVPDDEVILRESLRRCSAATIEAALAWRKTGNPRHLSPVVVGVVQRFTDPELRHRLDAPDAATLHLIDDLGIDSLTMMEIVMLVEEVTRMSISNEELQGLRSIGDINAFIDAKARGIPSPARKPPPSSTP